jgi:predicted nucleic acid-binding protein
MILLDTNVISELMRESPDETVASWVDAGPASGLYVTSISQAEILFGIQLLPKGRRRDGIAAAAREMFEEDFGERILGFGSEAAQVYAMICAARRTAGRPISAFDAQIAAIARSNGADLATRNVGDFASCGVRLINPWKP